MSNQINGLTDYNIDILIKFGGSTLESPANTKSAIAEISEIAKSGYRVLIFPGGGPTDNTIEQLDKSYLFSDETIHQACALCFDQTGLLICDEGISENTRPIRQLTDLRSVHQGEVPVILPSLLINTLDPYSRARNTSSDSMAAWLAIQLKVKHFLILTNVDGIYSPGNVGVESQFHHEISALDLCNFPETSVDTCLAPLLNQEAYDCWIVNSNFPERITKILHGHSVKASKINGGKASYE